MYIYPVKPSILHKSIGLYKDAWSGHPKEIWSLVIVTFINRMGTMVLPFLSVYLTTVLEFSLKDAGLMIGAFGLGSLGGSYLGGRASDRIGSNWVIVLSLAISGCFFIALQWGRSFEEIFALIFIAAFFGEAYRPAMMSAVADYVPKNKTGRTTAFIRLAINLGMSAGPAIGGFVAVKMGYNWLFWIDGITCILAAIYFAWVSSNWEKTHLVRRDAPDVTGELPSRPPYRNLDFMLFLLATFFLGFGFIQWFHSVPVFIKGEWGFDERYIGILLGMGSALIVVTEMVIIDWIEKHGKIRVALLIGIILIGCSYFPFLFDKALILCFISALLWTVGEILSLPLNTSISINMSPDKRRGDYMAWYWMTWSVANILAPVVGLGVAEAFGFQVFWIGLIGVVGLSFLLNWRLGERML